MLSKKQKEKIVEDLADKIKRQKVLVFSEFRGLKVAEMRELRKKLREEGIDYKITKKTLIKLALKESKTDADVPKFEGSLALAIGYDDIIAPPKIIAKFSKEHGKLKILGGILDNKFLSAAEVLELAKIPSREELLSRLLVIFNSPISGFVRVLDGNLRNLVGVLNAIKNNN